MPDYKHPDIEARVRKLLEVRPKHLCINGGEPLTVPGIVDILRRLRAGLGEHFYLEFNTNATIEDRLLQILPCVNGICFSIDGVGEVNKIYRGYDGDALLGTLDKVVKYKPGSERGFCVVVVPVATEKTYRRLPELIKRVEAIWKNGNCPHVSVDIKVVYPSSHPLSFAHKRDVWEDFIQRSVEWHEQFEIPVTVRGLAPASHLSFEEGARSHSRCLRQFFAAILEEDGHFTYCKPERYYDYFRERFDKGGIGERMTVLSKGLYTLFINPCDPACYFPCDHGEFIDDILTCSRASDIAVKARGRSIILSRDELREAGSFLRRHFHPDLVMDLENVTWRRGKPFLAAETAGEGAASVEAKQRACI
jgi:MoaA/NifB/PqqE/SkfB family radical SAM enzyme